MNNIYYDAIKQIIMDQEEEISEIFQRENIISRELQKAMPAKFFKHPNITAILGVRRSGKTLLSLLLLKNLKYGYINFDDERLASLTKENLNSILEAFYELKGNDLEYIILDEVQNIPGWELFASRLRRTKKVIITGSNAKLLSGELSTHLTGRYISYKLYPFSFREILKLKGFKFLDSYSTKDRAAIRRILAEYMKLGGFPEVYKIGRRMAQMIYEDILIKDILSRYKIKYEKVFKDLSRYLISNFANEITFSKLKNIFSLKDVHTIRNYVQWMELSYLIFLVEKFSPKLKQQILAPKKIYCIDTGIINSIAFQISDNKGRLYENIVAVELAHRNALNNNQEIYYWKDIKQHEVDFVIKQGPRVIQLIQVSYDLSNEETKQREIRNIILGSKELKCRNLLIITNDYEGIENISWFGIKGKIKFMPLWKWLIEKN